MYHNSNLPDPFHTRVNGCTGNQRPMPNPPCNQNPANTPTCKEQPVCKEKPVCKEQPVCKEKPICTEAPVCKPKPVCKEQPTQKKACVQEPPKEACAQTCCEKNEHTEKPSCRCTSGSNGNQLPSLLLILFLFHVI